MSTPCLIVYGNHAVYCSFDGYPDSAGLLLQTFWTDKDRVEGLISHGGVYCLGKEIGQKIDFDNMAFDGLDLMMEDVVNVGKVYKQCIFYHRDKGEELDIIDIKNEDLHEMADRYGADFVYIYKDDICRWECFEVEYNSNLKNTRIPLYRK